MLLVFQLRLDIFNHTALDQDIVHIVIKANAHRNIAPCLVRTKMAQTKITDHDGIASIAQANAPFSEACAYRSEEHTSELQSLMRISYAVFCLKKKTTKQSSYNQNTHN